MSRKEFRCKTCKKVLDVLRPDWKEHIKQDGGDLYCDWTCYNNRNNPEGKLKRVKHHKQKKKKVKKNIEFVCLECGETSFFLPWNKKCNSDTDCHGRMVLKK